MANKQGFRIPVLALAIAGALGLTGYTLGNGNRIIWSYFTSPSTNTQGSQTDTSTYNSNGLPTYAAGVFSKSNFRDVGLTAPNLPADLLSRISQSLPESKDISTNPALKSLVDVTSTDPAQDSDNKTNIQLGADADVWVTFLSEGASYLNSVGFFLYDPLHAPTKATDITSDQIILPNASMPSPLPAATTSGATTVYLGTIPKGKALGFFVVSNGWSSSGRTTPKSMAGVNEKIGTNAVFYSLKAPNPEGSTSGKQQHAILLDDQTVIGTKVDGTLDGKKYRRLVVGFEDLLRTSSSNDNDFNDVLLAVHVSPKDTSISPQDAISNLAKIPPVAGSDKDTDGDGVKDSLDEFPTDPTAASSRWPLGQGVQGTLAFEDSWPSRGDYDLNDMVMRYASQEILDASGKVSRVVITYRLDARGATYHSGFAVSLPGIPTSNIGTAMLSIDSATATTITPLATGKFTSASDATFELFQDVYKYTLTPTNVASGSLCAIYYNSYAGCAQQPFHQFVLTVNFNNHVATSGTGAFPTSPYNPFIFRTPGYAPGNIGLEIHLPGQQPSARADSIFFKTQDDKSAPGTSYTYMDANRLPWVLNMPMVWAYPQELTDVVKVYSSIVPWAQSSGTSNTSWYVQPSNPSLVYTGK
jgi:LruC domain-containing protein